MATTPPVRLHSDKTPLFHSSYKDAQPCKLEPLAIALLIVTCIGGIVAAGIGLGAHQAWLTVGTLSHVSQIGGMTMMGCGLGVSTISLAVLLVKFFCVSGEDSVYSHETEQREKLRPDSQNRIKKEKKRGLEKGLERPRNPIDLNSKEREIHSGLEAWVMGAPTEKEYKARTLTATKILNCYRDQTKSLFLSGYHLKSLPPEIGRLTHLTMLVVINTKIQSLPSQIGQLIHLKIIRMENNLFSSLPPEIGRLTELKELHLSGNRLESLPKEIDSLDLGILDLTFNSFLSPPDKMKEMNSQACIDLLPHL